jgi:hypothetical protein
MRAEMLAPLDTLPYMTAELLLFDADIFTELIRLILRCLTFKLSVAVV